MIFFWLSLVALVFALLGFFVHAFYFSRQGTVESLEREVEGLKRSLTLREKISSDGEREIAGARKLVQELERQLAQKSEQIIGMQVTVERQQEEIRLLQITASEISQSIAQTVQQAAGNLAPIPESSVVSTLSEIKENKIPLWKDNLNNILGTLDKIEKETKK